MDVHLKRFAIASIAQLGTFSGEFRDKTRIIHHALQKRDNTSLLSRKSKPMQTTSST